MKGGRLSTIIFLIFFNLLGGTAVFMRDKTSARTMGTMKRFTGSVAAILLTTVLAMSGFVPLAQAEPVAYEFEGEWVDAPERTLSGFDVLTSRWRLDINDDASAPANDEVEENNVVTLSAENAVLTGFLRSALIQKPQALAQMDPY